LLIYDAVDEGVLQEYSATVLAYVGDAVFELIVRSSIVLTGNRKVKDIHQDAVKLVKAESQAKFMCQIAAELSEEERDIARRGRNAKTHLPRNAAPEDYRMSTGFEALLGYLYLKGDEERLYYLVNKVLGAH